MHNSVVMIDIYLFIIQYHTSRSHHGRLIQIMGGLLEAWVQNRLTSGGE